MSRKARTYVPGRQAALASLWLTFAIGNCGVVLFLYFTAQMERDNFRSALIELNALSAPYVGTITAYYFADRRAKNARSKTGNGAFTVAVLVTLVWYLFIAMQLTRLVLLVAYVDQVYPEILE